MRAFALIPARSGSTRVTDKNIRPLEGHPLMAYSIVAARRSRLFEEVVVSSDSRLYGEVAEHYGARWLPRPADLATEMADLVGVATHAIEDMRLRGGDPEALCVMMPCCPLRRASQVVDQARAFESQKREFQLSVVDYGASHAQWALKREKDGRIAPFFGWQHFKRSQDLEVVHCPSGAIWWVRVEAFLRQQKFYGEPLFGESLPFPDGLDIDEERDFLLVEALASGFRAHGRELLEAVDRPPWKMA